MTRFETTNVTKLNYFVVNYVYGSNSIKNKVGSLRVKQILLWYLMVDRILQLSQNEKEKKL